MRPRLLFVYLQPTSFVLDDMEGLADHYDLRPFAFSSTSLTKTSVVANWIRQFKWLRKEIKQADAIFGWFADYHMLAPVWFGAKFSVPVVVSVGGYDAVHLPRLKYGVFSSKWRAPMAKYVLRNASVLAPVAEALIQSDNRFEVGSIGEKQGITAHVTELNTPHRVVPTGYDVAEWPLGPVARTPSVCSIANVTSERTFRLKGLDLLLRAAERMADVRFKIVGVNEDLLTWIGEHFSPTANVEIISQMPRGALSKIYQAHSVYAQLSRSEGLPNVLCEAMLSGCIPVVSRVGAMSDLVDSIGLVVDTPQVEGIVEAIRAALSMNGEVRERARKRIADSYTKQRRTKNLQALFDELIREGSS